MSREVDELQMRKVRGFNFGKSKLRKRRSGQADFKKRSRAAKKAARKSMGKRLAALRRFRKSSKFKQLVKARTQYRRMTASQESDAKQIVVEAIIDYLLEGGSTNTVYCAITGGLIESKDLGSCIDAIMSEIIKLDLNYHLVEVEVDEDDGSIYVYFDDQIDGDSTQLREVFARFGKVSKFTNPEDDPALAVNGWKIETEYKGGLDGKVENEPVSRPTLTDFERVVRASKELTHATR